MKSLIWWHSNDRTKGPHEGTYVHVRALPSALFQDLGGQLHLASTATITSLRELGMFIKYDSYFLLLLPRH